MEFGIATVVAITVMCYIVGLIVKASGLDNKWIPIICGLSGIMLGIVRSGRHRRGSGCQAAQTVMLTIRPATPRT